MNRKAVAAFLLFLAGTMPLRLGCPPPPPGEGEGEGQIEGQLEGAAEGEGEGAAIVSATLSPMKDATLFENGAGNIADGGGQYLFTGRTGQPALRRALVQFDVADAVPAGATIVDAKLTLHMSRTIAGVMDVSLFSVVQDWGEGGSNASGEEGNGTGAQMGDATWVYSFYNTTSWGVVGGDFDPLEHATASVNGEGSYTWASALMTADVQRWLDQPDQNFGWLLMADESTARETKRFDSRESPDEANRPRLVVRYRVDSLLAP